MKKFKLIDGHFSSEESREVLMNVFSGKIQFHQMKNLSSLEFYGKDDDAALNRIAELKQSISEILKYIEEAEKQGTLLEIKADFKIQFSPK